MLTQVGSGQLVPLEMCLVPNGQIVKKQIPIEKTKAVVDFATKKPSERLQSIMNGLKVRYPVFLWDSRFLTPTLTDTGIRPVRVCSPIWDECQCHQWTTPN